MARDKPKIGAGHAKAMFRLGLKELQQVFAPDSNIVQPSEYGIAGTLTPGEVAQGRGSDPAYDQQHGVHGPSEPTTPDSHPEADWHRLHELSAQLEVNRLFLRDATHSMETAHERTPLQRQLILDSFEARGQAYREAFEARGFSPPVSAVLNRRELAEYVQPARYHKEIEMPRDPQVQPQQQQQAQAQVEPMQQQPEPQRQMSEPMDQPWLAQEADRQQEMEKHQEIEPEI